MLRVNPIRLENQQRKFKYTVADAASTRVIKFGFKIDKKLARVIFSMILRAVKILEMVDFPVLKSVGPSWGSVFKTISSIGPYQQSQRIL